MIATLLSGTFVGVNAFIVHVEVDVNRGLPSVLITGLPDTAVRESKTRVESAIENSGFSFPVSRIAINLAPADIKKEGPAFDLPAAMGILQATGQCQSAENMVFAGELSLDGRVKPVRGILPLAIEAREQKLKNLVIPLENAEEASVVEGISIFPVSTLSDAVTLCSENSRVPYTTKETDTITAPAHIIDYSDVKGHRAAKRAVETAAAGGHNILFIGSPGAAKTMLARRIPTILPEMTLEESIETTKIYSITGNLSSRRLMRQRPFRSPHHTISDTALVGGSAVPKPGEITLAHNGVLFLDELTEFKRSVLEVMRQPLADHCVTISRTRTSISYPARFMLVASMNPCPCGYSLDPHTRCTCNDSQIRKYMGKISGPLLDRIDIHFEVPKLSVDEIMQEKSTTQSSEELRQNVVTARKIQTERFKNSKTTCNAFMSPSEIKKYCALNPGARTLLKVAIEKLGFTARAYDKILKLSRTIADLAQSNNIQEPHVAEAIQYRSLDRNSSFN